LKFIFLFGLFTGFVFAATVWSQQGRGITA